MKANIHPIYFDSAQVICACGNRFTIGSTKEITHVELCDKCHPFYTGEQKFIDTASRIQKFEEKQKASQTFIAKKAKKREQEKKKESGPRTLREMLLEVSK